MWKIYWKNLPRLGIIVSLTTDVPVGSNEECKHLVHDHKIDDFLKREKEIDEVNLFQVPKQLISDIIMFTYEIIRD